VIKTRKVSGSLTLALHDHSIGSFAIEASWTDYFPDSEQIPYDTDQYISTEALIALCGMAKNFVK
jgi:hypothetical protein